MKAFFKVIPLLVVVLFSAPGVRADSGVDGTSLSARKWDWSEAAKIPVQTGGRLKPLDSFAREMTLLLTGSRTFEGWQPLDLMLSWLTYPTLWNDKRFIALNNKDAKRQLGLDESRSRFSPGELFGNEILLQYANNNTQVPMKGDMGAVTKQNPRDSELKRLFERMTVFRAIVSGEAWVLIPQQGGKPWMNLAESSKLTPPVAPQVERIRSAFVALVKAYERGDAAASSESEFNRAAVESREGIEAALAATGGWNDHTAQSIRAETLYNSVRPFLYAWIFYVMGALLWGLAMVSSARQVRWLGWGAIGAGFAFHLSGILVRSYVAGRPPVTNMYESIVWVSFGSMLIGIILYALQRQAVIFVAAGVVSALALIAADGAPTVMDPNIHPLVPVLRSNLWLTIHVLTITLGYAAFFFTLGISNITLWKFLRRGAGWNQSVVQLNQITYRAMQFGVVLLAAGTILGGVWADYSWGRFWGWDPKETWALIALLCYLAILHARYTGWMGQFGFAAWTVAAFLSVMMAWYGVNFVLGAGLHSYGFASGGLAPVGLFCAVQALYVACVTALYKRRKT